mmetsp:Transcript_5735/g.14603  ORF Transcript_5735/g.14603 Transcript_5735/m.14603 type:complete len:189 (-) Transcript_5735:245-811(-)
MVQSSLSADTENGPRVILLWFKMSGRPEGGPAEMTALEMTALEQLLSQTDPSNRGDQLARRQWLLRRSLAGYAVIAAAAAAAADSDSDEYEAEAAERDRERWLRVPPGRARGIRLGERYQAVVPALSPSPQSAVEAAVLSAGEPPRAIVTDVPPSSERKRTADTDLEETAAAVPGARTVEEKRYRPER